jgi:hypothetical protein
MDYGKHWEKSAMVGTAHPHEIKRVVHTIHAVFDVAGLAAKYLNVLGG